MYAHEEMEDPGGSELGSVGDWGVSLSFDCGIEAPMGFDDIHVVNGFRGDKFKFELWRLDGW